VGVRCQGCRGGDHHTHTLHCRAAHMGIRCHNQCTCGPPHAHVPLAEHRLLQHCARLVQAAPLPLSPSQQHWSSAHRPLAHWVLLEHGAFTGSAPGVGW
jgi:hypothetical protein